MDIDDEVATKRIMRDKRITDSFNTFEEALIATKKRNKNDQLRYLNLYGIDLRDPKHYDFLIDTSYKTPEEVVQEILVAFKNHQSLP